jgi:hypothetical protein
MVETESQAVAAHSLLQQVHLLKQVATAVQVLLVAVVVEPQLRQALAQVATVAQE